MGLYQRHASRFWWMTYTMNEERYFESTKTTSKELAKKIWKGRRDRDGTVQGRLAG